MEVVFCGSGWLDVVNEIQRRLPDGVTVRVWDRTRPLAVELADASVVLPSNARLDAATIAAAGRLRLIQQPAAGYEGIDLGAARARGIPVCNAPGANANAVAETVLLLMLGLARRLPAARRAFAAATIGAPVGLELRGRALGLIGEGRTGARTRAVAEALGMTVRSVRSGATRADLLALAAASDFLSVHCPLNERTRGLVDGEVLAALRPGGFVINCARGAIVDRAALVAALEAGRLGGAGLDCFWVEPWDPADPVYARDDVVTLPHIGGSTVEAFGGIAEMVAENVRRLRAGEPLLNRVG